MTRGTNGDYDSDTILITDHPLLIRAAKINYDRFKVPTSLVSSVKSAYHYTLADRAMLDVKTSVNKIGEIINLSQYLNSLMWEKIHKGASADSVMPLYYDICKLAVLSGIEIDSAKKTFSIDKAFEISSLKEKYKITDDKKTVKPMFFKMILQENGYTPSPNVRYRTFDTSMDYLQKIVSRFNFRDGRDAKRKPVPFMDMVKVPEGSVAQGYYYSKKAQIVEVIRKANEEKKRLFADYDLMTREEKNAVWTAVGDIKQNCIEEVDRMTSCPATMYLTLKELDNKDSRDVARFVFEVLFGKPDESFFSMIKDSRENIFTLVEDDDGDLRFYDYRFRKASLRENLENAS